MEYQQSIANTQWKGDRHIITLKGDNRQLIYNAKFSYLTDNYLAAETALVVVNIGVYAPLDYLLLGEFGSDTAEIVQVQAGGVAAGTSTLTVGATAFSHSQDTRVTIIKYNQVRFFHTATAVFSQVGEFTDSPFDIDATSFSTKAYDLVNTTGYGWFIFRNEENGAVTQPSNAIPYAGFEESSVKEIFDTLFSLLNNKELKLINNADAFKWLNEGYSIARNELNLVNQNYNVPVELSVSTVAGTAEYALPSDFSDLVSVTDSSGDSLDFIELQKVNWNNDNSSSFRARYFIRNKVIGFSPVPDGTETYSVYYKSKTTELTSYYDNIDLPDNNFYPLVDHMLYRAAQKTGRSNPQQYEEAFMMGINRMKVTSVKQHADLDVWEVDPKANI